MSLTKFVTAVASLAMQNGIVHTLYVPKKSVQQIQYVPRPESGKKHRNDWFDSEEGDVKLLTRNPRTASSSTERSRMMHNQRMLVLALGICALLPTVTVAFTGISSYHVGSHAKSRWEPAVSLKSSYRTSLLPSRAGVTARMIFGAGEEHVDCLVIGGGVCGLTTAIYVKKGGGNVVLAEQGSSLGGNIDTKQDGDYTWEDGPNTFQPVVASSLSLRDAPY
eukprot:2866113-Rhodomonas_salina.2